MNCTLFRILSLEFKVTTIILRSMLNEKIMLKIAFKSHWNFISIQTWMMNERNWIIRRSRIDHPKTGIKISKSTERSRNNIFMNMVCDPNVLEYIDSKEVQDTLWKDKVNTNKTCLVYVKLQLRGDFFFKHLLVS